MSARRRAVFASLAVHVALALAVVRLAPPFQGPAAPAAQALEITIVRAPPAAAPTAAQPGARPSVEAGMPAPREPVVRHPRRRTVPTAGTIVTTVPTAPAVLPGPSTEPAGRECEPSPFLVPIDPRAVAMRELAGAMRAGPPVGGAVAGRGGERHAGRQDDLEQSLRGSVRGPLLSRRPPPVIRPAQDGGYDVEANRLTAHIAPDGALTFQDGPPIEDPHVGFMPGDREAGIAPGIGAGFRFDLNDGLFQALGEDPFRTERQWVLRETQELRDRLSLRARRVDEERALITLSAHLQQIAADRRLSAPQRRLAVFEVWDDCATDAIGERARAMVEQFVRDRFPAGTTLAYTETELGRLNRARVTGRPFAPYRGSPDAGPADGGA